MAPSKKIVDPSSSKGKATGTQASLKNFGFKGGSTAKKASVKPTTEEEDDLNDDDGDEEEEEEEEISTGKATKGTKKVGRPDLSDLPPMTNIPDIFADLVKHIPDMIKVAKTLKGRKLRVATMCSGTESPLLALNLIARALKKNHGVELQFEHVFSCEIVPWKQAYIERNFKPPILFRDVTELGYEEATTAYGAKAPVPIDVDMLIAGTSCVDYSTLNNQKQGFDAKGESGETFRGMKRWVERAKPPIVILENVCGAPWSRVVREFEEIDYSAAFSRFDTKNYYIPHTRTRVYLFAVRIPQDVSRPQKWLETVKSLQRPASAPYDAFLLQTDDPRIQQGREKLIKEDQNRQRLIDWAKCETRHARARMEEGLGNKRPLTNWSENGTCKMQDFAWIDWANAQVDRVWDLMDISFMRGAVEGYDPTYKSILWNLSQNVDRQIGSSVRGISPCLTPTMIAYLNYRGGPMLGLEALHLQGLPVDELVLTRETEDNLSDLAGNAMSSTVVGAAMMAAMCLCRDMLDEEVPPAEPEDQEMHSVEEAEVAHRLTTPGEDKICGLDQLSEAPLDLAKTRDVGLQEMLARAEASSRLCACEGRTGMSSNELWRCRDCDHTACSRCGGRPEHDFFTIDTLSNPRIRPLTFSKEATDALPMLIRVSGVDQQALDAARTTTKGSIPDSTWKSFSKAVLAATATDLSFRSLKRQEIWVAEFDSASAFLRFQMDPKEPQWLLYAKPDASEPTNSPVRHMLAYPIARLKLTDKLAEGKWELALPLASSFKIEIKGVPQAGEDEGLSDSWERRLGLQKDEFKDKKVWANLRITVPQESKSLLDEDIDGDYRWLPKCAAANASLHVKEGTDPTKPSIFFFLDPSRWGENDTDSFVFSSTFRRCEYGETRPVYAIVDPKWRQSDTMKTETMSCTVLHRWVALEGMSLQTSGSKDAVYSAPTGSLDFKVDVEACKSAQAILACQARLGEEVNENIWPLDEWREVDKVHERVVFQAIAFLMERLRDVAGQGEWISTSFAKGQPNCDLCSPPPPVLHWVLDKKGKGKKAIGVEDAEQAGVFERALKNRPSPFITQLMRDEDSIGHVRIGINIASLTHRAVDRLPSEGRQNPISTSYRITINYMPPAKLNRPKFTLKSNRRDPEHSQPPHFRIDLRPEQSRSLTWMLAQEQADVAEFEEEEIVEAILEPLGWRAEAKASRMVRVRGGVLADEVGYGKTVITLGLVACSEAEDWVRPKPRETKGLIAVKGTLVIVPPHLVKQWESEVRKFTGNRFEVIAIPGLAQLKKHSIKDIQNAQLVIVASNLFSSAKYLESLGAYAGAGALPGNYGRYFRDRLQKTLEGVRKQTELLQEEGASAVWEKILEGEKIDTSLQQKEEAMAPSKRLRGQKFREMAEARAKDKVSEATTTSADPETKASGSRQQMLDVYIDVLADDIRASYQSQQGSAASSRVSASSDEGGRSARRKAKAIVESDDDDDDDDVVELTGPTKKALARKGARADDDYSDEGVQSSSLSEGLRSDGDHSSSVEEVDPPTSKSKGKAKALPPKAKVVPKKPVAEKPSKKRKSTAADDDDEKVTKKAKTAAKKTTGKKASEKDKPSIVSQDPWGLKSSATQKNHRQMKSPTLEMFYWNRVVVDEYTYLKDEAHALITQLRGRFRWILSGTPPIHDFASLKTIAVFLGVHLGVDDEDENPTTGRFSDRTAVEKFHSFREVRSVDWYLHRYEVGQRFLDQFVRQNIAEIDEIVFHEHAELIILPAAERALERELDHTLRAQEMVIRRGKKTQSDRDKRIMRSLRESSSAEEALLKCVAYYDNVQSGMDNAMKACEYVVKIRKQELDECKDEIYDVLLKLEKQRRSNKFEGETHYGEWVRVTKSNGVGDHEATSIALHIYQCAVKGEPWQDSQPKPQEKKSAAKGDDEGQKPTKTAAKASHSEAYWEHRETAHYLRQLIRELIGRVRSYRYFEAVRCLQQEHGEFTLDCPKCGKKAIPKEEISLLSSCGHMGCADCVAESADDDACLVSECNAQVQRINIVPALSLGTDDEIKDARRHFGKKLEAVVDLITNRVPDDERVILFIQYEDLMKKVLEALRANDITCLRLHGTAMQQSEKLSHFQNSENAEKVLLLSLEDESASGANLTIANHVVFLSPMFAKSQEHYIATETQAIGRVRRYGQLREVHVWRFIARDTIDVEIYKRFTGRDFQKEVDEADVVMEGVEEMAGPSQARLSSPQSVVSSTAGVSEFVSNLAV